ncbi:hypothetical protein QFZ70_000658 [Arthrobacter sp. V1I9]|nr:hypothetical protein [Arthrobacter sp. V1I9]
MPEIETRTPLPLAPAAGCSCCPPSARAGEPPAAVVTSDDGPPSPTLAHLSP